MLTIKHLTAHIRQKSPHVRLHLAGVGMALALMLVLAPGAAAAPAGVNVTVVEGQSFTGNVVGGLTCPLASATITWGDGTSSAGTSDGATGIQGTHTYPDEGTYSGSVSFIYQQPATFSCPIGTQSASFQATVQDAPLSATGVSLSGTAGKSLSGVVGHFTDGNPAAGAGEFSAQINWGDGVKTFGTVTAAATGGFDVTGAHTYAAVGSYAVAVTLSDIGGSNATASSAAQIAAAPPPPPPPPPPVNISSRFIVNPSSPCILTPTLLDARDSTLAPGGTDTEYAYVVSAFDGSLTYDLTSLDPVFDVGNSLPYDNSQAVYRGQITRDVPGFGPWTFSVFRVQVLAPPVQVTLTVQQEVPGRGLVFGSSQVRTITFANSGESLLIAYPGTSFGDTPPAFVFKTAQQRGCPPVTARSLFGIRAVRSSVAVATLAHSLVAVSRVSSITLQVGCKKAVKGCFASLDVLSRAPRLSHAARKRVHQLLPPSLGSRTFVVPAGKTISLTVHLNARGRALARAHKLRKVTLLLGSVGAGGKIVRTVRTVRLRTGH